jgi:Ni/Co efflux regulator RcnB
MTRTTIACVVAALFAAATVATASEHEEREDHRERHEGRRRDRVAKRGPGVPADAEARALYRKECGACHLDFPPYFLPAESHRRLMAGLDRHFGQDAELDPAVRDRLQRYLLQNAAEPGWARDPAGRLGGGTPARITETRWFQGKHRHIDARVTARGTVRSLANCAACHAGAVDWDFDDDRVKIPAG